MAPKVRAVTAKALQALLTRIGSASSGTKDVLQERFKRNVLKSRLFALRPEWEERQGKSSGRKLRIISIDMGIKNLAYCDAEVAYPPEKGLNATMDIIRWDKIDLVNATRGYRDHLPNPRLISQGTLDADEDVDPYSLSVLSRTAYWFIKRTIVDVSPDIILIERQRWRSASSAAIQQWTVRVNTLEAMLHAILETLRTERMAVLPRLRDYNQKMDYEVYAVDPKRVGQYWLGLHARNIAEKHGRAAQAVGVQDVLEDVERGAVAKKTTRSKAEKKAKIALLRSWLSIPSSSTAPSTPASTPTISFTIGQGAVLAREALCLPIISTSRKSKKTKSGDEEDVSTKAEDLKKTGKEMKKLDDITDCFLQAAAWVAWESNRLPIMEVWERRRGDDGVLPALDDDIMLDMIKEAGEG